MSNSGLISYTRRSPNCTKGRYYQGVNHSIDRITPHCVVGQCSIEDLGAWFATPISASCNYGIGKDGRIGLIVDEANKSWCTSSSANDCRAVTIECASDKTDPYAMHECVFESLVKLCADICRRNGKTRLIWLPDKNKSLNYTPKSNEMLLTVHRWFANKACPGDWLYNRLTELANKVNVILGSAATSTTPTEPVKKDDGLLRRGSEGSAVIDLQKKLNQFGYKLSVDGDFGSATEGAVIAFQKGAGLDADGIVGPLTIAAIEKKLQSAQSSGAAAEESPSGSSFEEFQPYIVRVKIDDLYIRTGPGAGYKDKGYISPGAYTIVAEKAAGGLLWGKLKSGIGWICLKFTERVK